MQLQTQAEALRHAAPLAYYNLRDSTQADSTVTDTEDVDSTESDASVDSAEVTEAVVHHKWKAQAKTVFSTQKQHDGVDLSGNAPTGDFSLKLSHESGLYASVTGTQRFGSTAEYQQTTISGGYTFSAADWCDLSADLTLNRFPNDTINALASNPVIMSFAADFYPDFMDISLSLDHYFGVPSANYLSLVLAKTYVLDKAERFTLTPGFSIAYSSSKYKYKGVKLSGTLNVKGISSTSIDLYADYNLGSGFSLSLDPTILISFQRDLLKVLKGNTNALSKSTQLVVIAGLRYNLRF